MITPTIEFLPSPNCTRGRSKKISAIILHYTDSLHIEGTLTWFQNAASKVSAHYVIGRDGRIVQMVQECDQAWHAGRSAMDPNNVPPLEPNVNSFSLGIELVATADSGFTDVQMASLYTLLEVLVERYRVPPNRVVGHSAVAPGRKIDPEGYKHQFNWVKTRQVIGTVFTALPPVPLTELAMSGGSAATARAGSV